jgi:peroxiredoxin
MLAGGIGERTILLNTPDTTIAEQVAVLKQRSAERLPAEVRAVFGAHVAKLDADGVPAGVPGPGAVMPDGDLLDAHGRPTSLEAARGGRAAVVVFYRGEWCPYCNLTLRVYQDKLAPELGVLGVALIAVSPQKPDGALSVQEKNELSFTVLSDPGNQVGGRLGILSAQSDDMRAARATLGVNVADTNADGTDMLPMPAVVIVDAAGTIRWIDVHPNYTIRTEPAEILAALARVDR